MNAKKARLLRKAVGGYHVINNTEKHLIGRWPHVSSSLHFVEGKAYHIYKNLKRMYTRHIPFTHKV